MTFRDLPINRKLTRVIMWITVTVLLLAGASAVVFEFYVYRKELGQRSRTVAELLADGSAAPLMFQDEKTAQELLSGLRFETYIQRAAIYDMNGQIFARFPLKADPQAFPHLQAKPIRSASYLELFRPITHEGKRCGTVYLKATLSPLYDRVWEFGPIMVGILICSAAVGLALSRFLSRRISGPILNLADAARTVSDKKDYAVRVATPGADELGALTEAFNHMLNQIQEQDAALREKSQRLRLALEGSQMGTWDWNVRNDSVDWDAYHHPLFGLRPGEFSGKFAGFLQLIHGEDRDAVTQCVQRALEEKREFVIEYRVVSPAGEVRYLESRGKPFYDGQGKPLRVTGVTLDITNKKQSEEQIRLLNSELEHRVRIRTAELIEANQEMEAFTYSVAHDLRAPLRHIDAFAQMLQQELRTTITGDSPKYLERIRSSVQVLAHLVDSLLTLARIGRRELNLCVTDLNTIVQTVVRDFQTEAHGREVDWKLGHLPTSECDPDLMRQVFENLISNAFKYSRPRRQAVIEIGHTDVGGERAIFVRDNGVGFDMKFADKLFGVFQRLHRSDEFEGTGVGLATVDRIVRKHGGRIWAQAEPEKGATFYFTLGTTLRIAA